MTTPSFAGRFALAAVVLLAGGSSLCRDLRAAETSVLRVDQKTSGLPTRTSDKSDGVSYQTLLIDAHSQRVKLIDYTDAKRTKAKDVFILRQQGEESVVWHFPGGGKRYREIRRELGNRQLKRTLEERAKLRIILRMRARERGPALKREHLLPGLRRDVVVERKPSAKVLDLPCEVLLVTENKREIINGVIVVNHPTINIARQSGAYFEMYRRLGVFSKEVLDKLADVHGIPVRAKITVVTDLPPYTLSVDVSRLDEAKVDTAEFELPKGAEKIEDRPPFAPCADCGKKVETAKGRAMHSGPVTRWFCDLTCERAYRKKSRADRGARGGGAGTRRKAPAPAPTPDR